MADIIPIGTARTRRMAWWERFVATASEPELRAALAWLRARTPNPKKEFTMMEDIDEPTRQALVALRDDCLKFATGATPEDIEQLFAVIVQGWGMRPEHLPAVVQTLSTASGFGRGAVVMWLDQTFRLMQTSPGRKIALQLGRRAAEIEQEIADRATKH